MTTNGDDNDDGGNDDNNDGDNGDNLRELGLLPRMILHVRVLPVAKRKSRRAGRPGGSTKTTHMAHADCYRVLQFS